MNEFIRSILRRDRMPDTLPRFKERSERLGITASTYAVSDFISGEMGWETPKYIQYLLKCGLPAVHQEPSFYFLIREPEETEGLVIRPEDFLRGRGSFIEEVSEITGTKYFAQVSGPALGLLQEAAGKRGVAVRDLADAIIYMGNVLAFAKIRGAEVAFSETGTEIEFDFEELEENQQS